MMNQLEKYVMKNRVKDYIHIMDSPKMLYEHKVHTLNYVTTSDSVWLLGRRTTTTLAKVRHVSDLGSDCTIPLVCQLGTNGESN